MSRCTRTFLLLVVITLLPARPALAWKLETHIWLASKLVAELRASGCNVTIAPFGNHLVRQDVCNAILNNEGAFLLGVLGADIYPDMVSGQFTTHPGVERSEKAVGFVRDTLKPLGRTFTAPTPWHTDDWLDFVRRGARPQAPAEVAFAHGYMVHAAMDMWAHTYVNIYSGGVFSLADEQEVEFRHMALESFIKHTHKSFLVGSGGARRTATGLPVPGQRVIGFDALTALTAPIAFVRDRLVLNADVAQQYAMQEATLHLWAMYTYWNEVRSLTARIDPLLTAASQVRKTLDTAITQSNAAFQAAQSAYDTADRAYKEAVKAYNSLLTQHGKSNPLVQTAKAAMDNALRTFEDAAETLEPLKLKRDMRRAVGNIERDVQKLVRGPIDQWRQHLERAVDAYILAWQDTSKELMRPKPTALSIGSDPTGPVTRWATCWGPTFGIPVTGLSVNCEASLSGFKTLIDTLTMWRNDTFIKEPLRTQILDFERAANRIAEDLVIKSGQAFSAHIGDKGVAAGFTRSLVTLRSKETPTPEALDAEFRDNTSTKKLVTYTQVRFSDIVLADMGFKQMPHDKDLAELGQFAPLQNSMTMSKLVLLGGAELNGLVARATSAGGSLGAGRGSSGMVRDTRAPSVLYVSSEPTGIVLIGAVRSIDGDHQWQRLAPPLPVSGGLPLLTGRATETVGVRSPTVGVRIPTAGKTVPALGNCRVFGYDNSELTKRGLRLWQDLAVRRALFNQIFLSPLTPGLETHIKAVGFVPAQGLGGIATADGAYPPSNVSGCGPG